jgi:hypothetical protein
LRAADGGKHVATDGSKGAINHMLRSSTNMPR